MNKTQADTERVAYRQRKKDWPAWSYESDGFVSHMFPGYPSPARGTFKPGVWFWSRGLSSYINGLPARLYDLLPGEEDPVLGGKEYPSEQAAREALGMAEKAGGYD